MTEAAPASLLEIDVGEYPRALQWAPEDHSGTALAVGTASGDVLVVPVGREERPLRWRAHDGGVCALAWHPSERRLATAGEDGAVRLWSGDGDQVTDVLAPATTWAEHVAFSPDGKQLAAARGRELVVHDIGPNRRLDVAQEESTIAAMAYSPSGKTIATTGYGGVRLYAPTTGALKRRLRWKGSMLSLGFSPDGRVVSCGCQDGSVHFWRLPEGEDSQMSGYPAKPVALAWSGDGTMLATAGAPAVTIWPFDGKGPEGRTPTTLKGHDDLVTALAFTPGVPMLASGCREGRVCLWAPGKRKAPLRAYERAERIDRLTWTVSPAVGDLLLAATDAGGRVTIWPFGSGRRD